VTTFTVHQDVAAVEHDPETLQPLKGGQVIYGTITDANEYGISVRFSDGDQRAFFVRNGKIIQVSHHWRLFRVCDRAGCESPILGEPVTDPEDPKGREFCSEGCLDSAAEASRGAFANERASWPAADNLAEMSMHDQEMWERRCAEAEAAARKEG
jgi:hypothetical protein